MTSLADTPFPHNLEMVGLRPLQYIYVQYTYYLYLKMALGEMMTAPHLVATSWPRSFLRMFQMRAAQGFSAIVLVSGK